jgi:hypothetical protein
MAEELGGEAFRECWWRRVGVRRPNIGGRGREEEGRRVIQGLECHPPLNTRGS